MSDQQTQDVPAQQGDDYKVGPGCPPKEHQWQPGQSGNPAGSPKAKTNLYKHISKYSGMTDAELAQLDLESLTQSEKAGLKIVQDMAAGRHTGAEGLAKYIIDREEGRIPENLRVDVQPQSLADIAAITSGEPIIDAERVSDDQETT